MQSHRLAFVYRRLFQLVPVILAIASFNFVLIHFAPGDAADIIAGQGGYSTIEYVEGLRKEFGLDKPLYQQYLIYMGKALTLDLGFSPVQQKPVLTLIIERLPATDGARMTLNGTVHKTALLLLLTVMMLSLPFKMLARWLFNLKYVVSIPEFFFNI